MNRQTDSLRELQRQVLRKKRLETLEAELSKRKEELEQQAEELREQMQQEQKDVDRLEGRSLSALFSALSGSREEKLEKERAEAYAAAVKYEVAARELDAVNEDQKRCQAELSSLSGCEEQYARALEDRSQAIQAAGGQAAEEIHRCAQQTAFLENQEREILEALEAGKRALEVASQVSDSLNSAENWGIGDLIGGGFLFDFKKHEYMDEAQDEIEQLQVCLLRFRTELTDISISADMEVRADDFLRFADYFFDGLLVDWSVQNRIRNAQDEIQVICSQIQLALERIQTMLAETSQAREAAAAELERRICAEE